MQRSIYRRAMNACGLLALWAGCGSSSVTVGSDGGPPPGPTCGTCFVHGRWQVSNLSPCFVSRTPSDGGASMVVGALSTTLSGGAAMCPANTMTTPTDPWSTDTLTTDCPGHYRLCVALKAGNAQTPLPDDCTVAASCADGDYATAGQAQPWADLPGWMAAASDLPCATKFHDHGGYAQLTATGTATGCGTVSRTVGIIVFCPLACMSNPMAPGCATCKPGGTGDF